MTMTGGGAPRASVCIPTINRPHLLREALASVAAQTYRDFEVVVADNSGRAEGQQAIDRVVAEFSSLPIRLVRHPTQIDAAANFNSLIDAARGTFWACLPDDDRLCPAFLALAAAALEKHPTCTFAFGDHWILRADGTVDEPASRANSARYGRDKLKEGELRGDALFGAMLAQSSCLQASLFRRSAIAAVRFTPNLLTVDYSLFLRLGAAADAAAYYVPERLMEYRIHGEQITVTTRRVEFLRSEIDALESIKSVPPALARPYRTKLSRQYLSLALLEAEAGAGREARRHARDGLRLSARPSAALRAAVAIFVPGALSRIRRLATWARRRSTPTVD